MAAEETSAQIEIPWAGEERAFLLGVGQIRKLQIETRLGVEKLLQRFVDGDWFIDEIAWVLRLGLEGAGETPQKAKADVDLYCLSPSGRLEESLSAAKLVLYAVLDSLKAVQLKKAMAARTKSP